MGNSSVTYSEKLSISNAFVTSASMLFTGLSSIASLASRLNVFRECSGPVSIR